MLHCAKSLVSAGYLYFHCSGVPCKGSVSKTVRVCLLLAFDEQVCMTVIEADTGASLVGLCRRAGRRAGGFVTVRSWLKWQIQVFAPIVFLCVYGTLHVQSTFSQRTWREIATSCPTHYGIKSKFKVDESFAQPVQNLMSGEVDPLEHLNILLQVARTWNAASSKYEYYSNDNRRLYCLKQ